MKKPVKYVCPLLVVADMASSRNFYEHVLEQKVIMDFGENVTFAGDFAIHLQSHYQNLIGGKEIKYGGHNGELYFEYDDMDQLSQKLIDAQVELVHEMREQPWRQRVIRIYDPDRHIIEIGESLSYLSYRLFTEGLSADEISKTMMMPLEFVEKSIENQKNDSL